MIVLGLTFVFGMICGVGLCVAFALEIARAPWPPPAGESDHHYWT